MKEVIGLIDVVERVRAARDAVMAAQAEYEAADRAYRAATERLNEAHEEFGRARGAVLAVAIGEP